MLINLHPWNHHHNQDSEHTHHPKVSMCPCVISLLHPNSLVAQTVKNLMHIWFLGWEDPLEKRMGTHSDILAWKMPWTEEPGGLQSMKSQRAGHDWPTNTMRTDIRISPTDHLWCKALCQFPVSLHLSIHVSDIPQEGGFVSVTLHLGWQGKK